MTYERGWCMYSHDCFKALNFKPYKGNTMESFMRMDKLSDVFMFRHCSRGFSLQEFCILLT